MRLRPTWPRSIYSLTLFFLIQAQVSNAQVLSPHVIVALSTNQSSSGLDDTRVENSWVNHGRDYVLEVTFTYRKLRYCPVAEHLDHLLQELEHNHETYSFELNPRRTGPNWTKGEVDGPGPANGIYAYGIRGSVLRFLFLIEETWLTPEAGLDVTIGSPEGGNRMTIEFNGYDLVGTATSDGNGNLSGTASGLSSEPADPPFIGCEIIEVIEVEFTLK